jgi:hypothetical protein
MALNEAQENEKNTEQAIVKYQTERSAISEVVDVLDVTDKVSFSMAEDVRRDLDNLLCEVDAFFDPMVKLWHEGHKLTLSRKKAVYEPLSSLKKITVAKIDHWINEEKRKEEDKAAAEQEKNREAIESMNRATRQAADEGAVVSAQDFSRRVAEVFILQPPDEDPAYKSKKTEIVKDVEVTVLKPLAFMAWLVSEDAMDIDGSELVEWKMSAIEKMVLKDPARKWPDCLSVIRLYKSKLGKGQKNAK